ncbi:indolepyruvate ferredoxin oxidoreductase subunit alpha [Alkalibaculum sp. M08DMB]|uniref:Indolepyruvate oxidoreductase subunit IorA n=1 Tax=Alkalibaculum sporogenes TaxID=2655001 RepID=A0A6A7K919_9FIRM|nr:indolepyruvate ferredoxin oxidoreductase subunit alpha [Alkalibaculum sporogenes]MPW25687.1 indolepyruvate ferredoxin oxidoreductase subunit alpha [Alkalibaculum sporogenes]
MKKLMTGNEAIARGAYEAGVLYASAYAGTPSTEILENIALYSDMKAEWATNEKVALEAVCGASIAGARAIAAMKHVGVNVASDALFTQAYTGVNGGIVLVTADEPGQHSSQDEQDNRNYAPFAKIPLFEPANSQECKDMIKIAFEVSEQYDTPVLVRMTTRVCHSKDIVDCVERVEKPIIKYEKKLEKYVTVPAFARKRRVVVEQRMHELKKYSNATDLNFIEINDTKVGVIASGVCYHYAKEMFGENASYLKIGFGYPLPDERIKEFASKVETIYIIEENDPIIENFVKVLGIKCIGKDIFPSYGEMTPDILRKSIDGKTKDLIEYNQDLIVNRAPTLCAGCPHRGVFYELGKRKDIVIAGDIGCYSLGFAEPYNAMDFNVCMGSAFSSGHGAQQVFDMQDEHNKRVVTVLGDSTFFHTGINGLINTVYNKSKTVNLILDNRITGMTGHQENPGSGYTLQGEPTQVIDIEGLVVSCGIKHIKVIDPNNLQETKESFNWALGIAEPSVIITRWPCALKKFSIEDKEEFPGAFSTKYKIDQERCIGCKKCIKTGCPAIAYDKNIKKSKIDNVQCVGCGVCVQVCPVEAIRRVEE